MPVTTAKSARRRCVDLARDRRVRVLLLRWAAITVALGVGAGACQLASSDGDSNEVAEPLGAGEQAVISGSPDAGNDFSAVAQIVRGGPIGCSAFYLGNRTMLTAGHCVADIISGCTALGPGAVAFRFAADDGTVVSVTNDAARRVNADAFLAQPGASLDIASCGQTSGCSTTTLECDDMLDASLACGATSPARASFTNRAAEMVLSTSTPIRQPT